VAANRWTADAPTAEGHYWVETRTPRGNVVELVWVIPAWSGTEFDVYRAEHISERVDSECFLRWYGPLTAPPFEENPYA